MNCHAMRGHIDEASALSPYRRFRSSFKVTITSLKSWLGCYVYGTNFESGGAGEYNRNSYNPKKRTSSGNLRFCTPIWP